MGPLVVDGMQGNPPSFGECSSIQRGQKRSTEDADSDVEFVCMTKVLKRTVKKKVKHQQPSYTPALSENLKSGEASQAGFFSFSFSFLFSYSQNV